MLAIIPARGGSKGIPDKNIKIFAGKPLIVHTIEAAKKAKGISRIIVSTDSEKIAQIAIRSGAEIPFMRPKRLATDSARAIDNYIYTLSRLNSVAGKKYSHFMVLQPTSPLRTSKDIDNAIQLFFDKKADSVISVCESWHPVEWTKRIDSMGILKNFILKNNQKNKQAYIKTYIPNGALFVFKLSLIEQKKTYYSGKTYAYLMPKERSIDIDDDFDFEMAQYLMGKQ